MPTKKQLEEKNRELSSFSIVLLTIVIVCLATIVLMMLQPTDRFDGCWDYLYTQDDLLRYSFSDPVDYYINVSDLDRDCILSVDDYSEISGNVWLNIKPECVKMSHHIYKVMT